MPYFTKLKNILAVLVFSFPLSLLLLAPGCQPPAAGVDLYSLRLPDPEGAVYNIADDRGRVVLVVYWATWCGACRDEMPLLNELHRKYADQGLTILAWSVDDSPQAEGEVKRFMENNRLAFKALMIKDHFPETVDRDLVRSVPTFKLYSRDGHLLDSIIGGTRKGYWDVAILNALRS